MYAHAPIVCFNKEQLSVSLTPSLSLSLWLFSPLLSLSSILLALITSLLSISLVSRRNLIIVGSNGKSKASMSTSRLSA